MATTVISPHEIILNSVRFPINGFVQEGAIDRFPEKMLIGLPDYENEQLLSNWVMSDFRGGQGIEEMDEAVHKDRYWWSTCETRFRSNLLLGPLATLATNPSVLTPTITDADMEAESAAWVKKSGLASGFSGNFYRSGAKSLYLQIQGAGPYTTEVYQALSGYLPGAEYTFTCWVYHDVADGTLTSKVGIDDGVSATYGSTTSANGTWTQLSVTKTIAVNATQLHIYLWTQNNHASLSQYSYWDDAAISGTALTIGTSTLFVEFNSKLYASFGKVLGKLNAGGTGYDAVAYFSSTITALIQNGTNLFILLNTNAYWYMDTDEAFTLATPTGAVTLGNKGIWWDDKLFQFNTDGNCKYSAAPATAAPAYTANGKLPIAANELQELLTYFDAGGDDIIYCSTKVGLFSHDFTNAKFLHTALKVPSHPTAGKGAVVWHDACFISAGLNVSKYIAESTATIEDVGLSKDDGLPQLRSGEVIKFIEGYSEFFALIDSTYEGALSYSQVVSYDGKGWRNWWEATAVNKNMYGGIVSSVYAYRLWFSTTDGVYYITLQRHNVNPKKVSGYTYKGTSAIDIGSAATDRGSTLAAPLFTIIDLANPANLAGYLTSIEIWAATALTGMRVGSFYLVSGTTYKCRDSATIGAVTAGSKQTFTTDSSGNLLAIAVEAGDFIGCYFATGSLERDTSGGSNVYYVSGEYIDPDDSASYSLYDADAISLYSTGIVPAGIHITPRFDAGTKAFRKLATKLTLFLDDMTANETVVVTYQIDQAQGALTLGWTALVPPQTADGVKEQTFGTSGVGILFYDIQFRLALARGSTNTLSPIVKGMVLSYLKILGRKRSWSFTINTAEAGRVSSTPKTLTDAIATILATNTLMLFTFRDGSGATDTKYVMVQPFSGEVPTGQEWQSLWNFTCIEV